MASPFESDGSFSSDAADLADASAVMIYHEADRDVETLRVRKSAGKIIVDF